MASSEKTKEDFDPYWSTRLIAMVKEVRGLGFDADYGYSWVHGTMTVTIQIHPPAVRPAECLQVAE